VKLDDAHYKLVDRLERLVKSPPSLRHCSSLTVKGPVRFGEGVVIRWVSKGRTASAVLEGMGAGLRAEFCASQGCLMCGILVFDGLIPDSAAAVTTCPVPARSRGDVVLECASPEPITLRKTPLSTGKHIVKEPETAAVQPVPLPVAAA
jgi:hypothetical protein